MQELDSIVMTIQRGNLERSAELVPFLTHADGPQKQKAQRVFAHCCKHSQVEALGHAVLAAEDVAEVCRILLRLGDTLSLLAIPIILATAEELADEELDGYAALALGAC